MADTAALSPGLQKLAKKGTQAEIAKVAGVSQQAVSRWLSGQGKPSAPALLRISQRFRIPIRELVTDKATGTDG